MPIMSYVCNPNFLNLLSCDGKLGPNFAVSAAVGRRSEYAATIHFALYANIDRTIPRHCITNGLSHSCRDLAARDGQGKAFDHRKANHRSKSAEPIDCQLSFSNTRNHRSKRKCIDSLSI